MSASAELCAVIPDFDGCEAFREPEPTPDQPPMEDGGKMEGGERDGMRDGDRMLEDLDPTMGQIAYTAVATTVTAGIALDIFRYRTFSDFYTDSNDITKGYWKLGAQIMQYAGLAFFGVASLTQILSNFGILAEVNLMVWGYGGMAYGAAVMIASALVYYAYDLAATSSDANDIAVGETIRSQMTEMGSGMLAAEFELTMQYANWMAAQWMALDEETQAKYRESKREDKEDMRPEDMLAFLF